MVDSVCIFHFVHNDAKGHTGRKELRCLARKSPSILMNDKGPKGDA